MENKTKQKILGWVWKWTHKILNYHEPIIHNIEMHTEKIQLLSYKRCFSRQEMEYLNDSFDSFANDIFVKKMAESLFKEGFVKIEKKDLKNGDLMIEAYLRVLPWKEQK